MDSWPLVALSCRDKPQSQKRPIKIAINDAITIKEECKKAGMAFLKFTYRKVKKKD